MQRGPCSHTQEVGINFSYDVVGFRKAELNGRYIKRQDMVIRGEPSYWHALGTYFGYFETSIRRWSICGVDAYNDVLAGKSLGWAFQLDDSPFAQTAKWLERSDRANDQAWPQTTVSFTAAHIEVPVPVAAPASAPVAHVVASMGDWASNTGFPPQPPLRPIAVPSSIPADTNGHLGGNHAPTVEAWGQAGGSSGSNAAWAAQQGRSGFRERAGWAEDRNVQPRTSSGPSWASSTNGATLALGGRGEDEQERTLEPVDWASLNLPPFHRVFLQHAVMDPQQALARRQEMNILIEEDPQGEHSTPAPIQAFFDLHCIPVWVHRALTENAWEYPLPVQAQALPILLGGRSLIGIAQTGSGKTASFLLPAIVQIDAQPRLTKYNPGPVALVLSPTRELAVQISDEAAKLLKFSNESRQHPDGIKTCVFYGGGRKWQQLRCFGDEGSHILVATPGRLLDFMKEGSTSLRRVTYLVFDEADRMLDLGFADDMKTVSSQVRPERQMAFFSATWPKTVQSLACEFCADPPVRIRIGGANGASAEGGDFLPWSAEGEEGGEVVPNARESIIQEVVVLENERGNWEKAEEDKISRIKQHVESVFAGDAESKVLIFVNEKGQVDRLSNDLWDKGFQADGIHSGRKQDMRLEVLEKFRRGEVRVLVATDVIGRGLDIPKVSHVIIHTMGDVDDYVHRIGRTGRGKDGKGHALVFFEFYHNRPDNAKGLIGVLERAKQPVPDGLRKIAASVASGELGSSWGGVRRSWSSGGWKDKDNKAQESGNWKSKGNWSEGSGWKEGGWKSGGWKDSPENK